MACSVVVARGLALGQVPTQPQSPAFEVASVKPTSLSAREALNPINLFPRIDAGRVEASGYSLDGLIAWAYRVKSGHVSGPSWLTTERFDIVAKIPEGSSKDQIPEMVRALLSERFKLVAHKEQKPVPVYALVVGPKGVTFKESDPGDATRSGCTTGRCDGFKCHKVTMQRLAERMSVSTWQRMSGLDLPVVDSTGMTGAYDFDLDVTWVSGPVAAIELPEGCGGAGNSAFTALKALGLGLERQKQMQDFVVVESVLRAPTPN
jgi:uncharacterized protein (TIGR03435 family)